MKRAFKTLIIILVMTLSSCSDSNVHISSEDNFEIVELPDGSIAYLNNNSSIEFDRNFGQRIVKQDGEVFFDVRKGDSPFIVKTELGEIQVLGTKFNVRSDNNELEVEVQEGTVELKINKFIKKVKRGQKAFFKESKATVKIYKAEFKHKSWIKDLNKDFKKFGKEMNKSFKHIGKESKKIGIEIGNMVNDV
jgi:ferric-dicitrate binding protein FerR (iron transport regulator)